MKTLILGLGNDLLGDDAVGILASRRLAENLKGQPDIEVLETAQHGVALLEFFLGYDRAIVIDAIKTGEHPAGSVVEIDASKLRPTPSPSPVAQASPSLCRLLRSLNWNFRKRSLSLRSKW